MSVTLNAADSKQPKALKVFCFSMFFERYGVYLVQALLTLYLVNYFKTKDTYAYSVLGSFIALSFIMPLVGGFLADKYLGFKKTIYYGALIEASGLLLLIVPGSMFLILGLSIISIGMGMFKPSTSSLLGFLYKKDDPRQDGGYTLFYMIFNGGIICATFLSGFIVRYCGWQIAFATAVVALLITFFVFYWGVKRYKLHDLGPKVENTFKGTLIALLIVIVCIILGYFILSSEVLARIAFIGVSVLVLGIFAYCIKNSDKEYKSKLVAFFILLVISTLYWALYMQMFLSITLFIENVVNKTVLFINIPTPAFSAIESFGVIIFGYPVAKLWGYLSQTKYNPSLPMKFCFGMILLCLSFGAFVAGSHLAGSDYMVNPLWIVAAYLLMAIGELALSPIGLSMVKVLVPEQFNGMMMGIFLLTIGLGGKIAGLIAGISNIPENINGHEKILGIYTHAFNIYLLITVICTIIAFLTIPYIKKKMAE